MIGLDAVSGGASPESAKRAGALVLATYLGRNLTRSLVQRANVVAVATLPIYEETGRPGDFNDGARQGTRAAGLIAAIPELAGYGCVFTDDVSNAPYTQVREWCRGIRSTFHGHLVYYGPSDKGDQLVDERLADSVWVEGAWGFSPGYNPRNPQPPACRHACGWQYPKQPTIDGVPYDYNEFTSAPWLPGHGPQEVHPLANLTTEDQAALVDAFGTALTRPNQGGDSIVTQIGKSCGYWSTNQGAATDPKAADAFTGASVQSTDAKLDQIIALLNQLVNKT